MAKSYPLFIWDSNLTGYPALLFAKSGNTKLRATPKVHPSLRVFRGLGWGSVSAHLLPLLMPASVSSCPFLRWWSQHHSLVQPLQAEHCLKVRSPGNPTCDMSLPCNRVTGCPSLPRTGMVLRWVNHPTLQPGILTDRTLHGLGDQKVSLLLVLWGA